MEAILQNKVKPEIIKVINNIQFTNREIDVIACILAGRATKKIAFILDISVKTAENHIHNIMLKIGCSSRERVVDFVEKSKQFSAIKKYYSNLLINVTFETKLKKIATFTKHAKPINLTIYYQGAKKDTFITQLEKHLNLAGICVCSEVWKNNQINITSDTQLANYLIYNMSQELTQCLETKEPNSNYLYSLVARCQGCTILLELKSEVKPHDINHTFSNVISISLDECENYYFLVFEILKRFLKYDLIQIINEFKKQYKIFLDYSYLQQHPTAEDFLEQELDFVPWRRKNHFSRKKFNIILLTLLSCFGLVLNVKNFITLNHNKHQQNSDAIIHAEHTSRATNNLENIYPPLITSLKTWPIQLPAHDNARFIKRKINNTGYMKMLHAKLQPKTGKLSTLVIHGIGGVGKTQIVKHYIHSKLANANYCYRLWFNAENKETLDRSYLEFAKALGIVKTYTNSMEYIKNIVLHWLEEHPNWLIVFDNVVDYDNIDSYLPRHGGSVLITSQHAIWPTSIQTLHVTPMQKTEAIRLIHRVSGRKSTQDHLLVEKLGNLPLAVAQAASYMQVYGKTAQDYLGLYARCKQELLNKDLRKYGMEHEPVLVTWNNSLKSIENELPLAKEFLNISAYLTSEKIPKIVLTHLINQKKPTNDAEMLGDEIIAKLLAYSLIDRDNNGKYFNIHRLLQTSIRAQNKYLGLEQNIIANILDILVPIFTKNTISIQNFQNNCDLLPHIDTILKYAKKYLHDPHIKLQMARLLNVKAYFYTQTGMTIVRDATIFSKLAKEYCQDLLNITEEEFNRWLKDPDKLNNRTQAFARNIYAKLVTTKLSSSDREILPILYTSILYSYGRMYFYNKANGDVATTKAYLLLSKELGEVIAKNTNKKIFYTLFAETSGLLYFINEFNCTERQLNYNIARYKELIKEQGTYITEDGQQISMNKNFVYKMACLKKMLRSYAILAQYNNNKQQDGLIIANKLLKYISLYTNNIEGTASYYNAIGFYYLAYGNYAEAKLHFTKAITIELSKNNSMGKLDHRLADAYYGLTIAEFYKKDYTAANKAIINCLQLREILYQNNDNRLIITKQYAKEIQHRLKIINFYPKRVLASLIMQGR